MSEPEGVIMNSRNVALLSISMSFVIVYLSFGPYAPRRLFLKVSTVCFVMLGISFVWSEINET